MNWSDEPLKAAEAVLDVLEALNVRHYLGGSVASSIHGEARTTTDVDLIADLSPEHVQPFVDALDDYYLSEDAIRSAVRRRKSFNVIFLPMMFKVDIFVPGTSDYDRISLDRICHKELPLDGVERRLPFASAEDVVLNKLDWYRKGGEVSDRQWGDVVSTLKYTSTPFDLPYLRQWAEELNVSDLLEEALHRAGLTGE